MILCPELLVVDDVLPPDELARWRRRALESTEQSTGLPASAVEGERLLALCREHVGDLRLVHVLLFCISEGCDTEMHQDVGEYAVMFYPFTNKNAPLRIDRGQGEELIEVRANRMVFLACTPIKHQQVVPSDGSTRYSVAFKFLLPE